MWQWHSLQRLWNIEHNDWNVLQEKITTYLRITRTIETDKVEEIALGIAIGKVQEHRTSRRTGREPRIAVSGIISGVTSHAFSDVKMSRQSARLYLHYKTGRVTYCRGRLVVLKIMCRPQLSLPSGSAARIIAFHPYDTLRICLTELDPRVHDSSSHDSSYRPLDSFAN